MDDVSGRAQAAEIGLEVMGLTGVLLAAKRAALIDAVGPIVTRLARRGFTIPEEAQRGLLREAAESNPTDTQ
jgi:predicted nucleic acid-binding protein